MALPPLPEGVPGPYCRACTGVMVKSERVGDVLEGPAPPLEPLGPMSMGWDGEDEGGMKLNG